MGSRASRGSNSTSQRTMDEEAEDYSAVLAYLLRSGQIRLLSPGEDCFNDSDEAEAEEDDSQSIREDDSSHTNGMDGSDLKQEMLSRAGATHNATSLPNVNITRLLQKRQIGSCLRRGFSPNEQSQFGSVFLPNHHRTVAHFPGKVFCGTYSMDGSVFLSACQDQNIRLYDVKNGYFKKFKEIRARDVGWSILDTAFSPDGNFVIYSSWSHSIHLCNIYGEDETHNSLDLSPYTEGHFCAFSIRFSNDGSEILAGANDGCLYVYDREKNERTMRIESHEDDVSAVCFADQSSQILFSGADDGMCKVWDRRMLDGCNDRPIGTFAGHFDGITYIDSKGDGRHLITNSKDQSIKLWDMRCFSPSNVVEASRRAVAQQHWDYRWQQAPRKCKRDRYIKGDTSLMTYKGHSVLHTLLRCRFSPQFTTGQRYIYAASAGGSIVIYDVLTGDTVRRLPGHSQCVRDVSWHPYENKIISSGWDGYHILHQYKGMEECEDEDDFSSNPTSEEDDIDIFRPLRRSQPLFSDW
ncbi:DDB1- and CUL4-associated factor 11 isoform X2 [Strongylocentrotus purpuratus]|uniref:DDB1- and CUL4-associated factor 11 n=1 Tax=Strongylocentrotus purpuratus TaxID=7668 RepID=A0A7M7LT50_STRPU|nr:DDB1- and CUL4-associated factor 11 isoform X2 [Strongylocentrotus purpuratus]|eukprot:XP_011670539.1 PREDICTED: DDB1- and CUL4-associated factor 11 isoform X2 [Strongylocentrotus purpuratus]